MRLWAESEYEIHNHRIDYPIYRHYSTLIAQLNYDPNSDSFKCEDPSVKREVIETIKREKDISEEKRKKFYHSMGMIPKDII